MYWSKYNIVFESPYGRFIYNTFTNNLMEMNASLISCIDKIISGDFSYLSEDDVLALKKNMILVDDDTNIYRSIVTTFNVTFGYWLSNIDHSTNYSM